MAALLLMVAWNMSEAHKVVDLLRHAPKDDIIVMLLCMSLTRCIFHMVIAISVGMVAGIAAVYASYRTYDSPGTGSRRCSRRCSGTARYWPAVFAAAEGLFTDLESRLEGKRIVILKWDAVPVLDAGGLDAFQRFVKRLPEGCELRVCNVEFQPLRTMARAGIQPIPGRLAFFPNHRAAMAGFISTRLTSQRKLTGQQTALFVSYDGDYRYGGNVCHHEAHSNWSHTCSCPPTRAPASQRMAPTKILSTAPCAKYWGILNCGNW